LTLFLKRFVIILLAVGAFTPLRVLFTPLVLFELEFEDLYIMTGLVLFEFEFEEFEFEELYILIIRQEYCQRPQVYNIALLPHEED